MMTERIVTFEKSGMSATARIVYENGMWKGKFTTNLNGYEYGTYKYKNYNTVVSKMRKCFIFVVDLNTSIS